MSRPVFQKLGLFNLLKMRIAEARRDAERFAVGSRERRYHEYRALQFEREIARELWRPKPSFDDAEMNLAEDRVLN